ncbi:hypothetical protein TYRP_006261 [Tyrophagus putrescentiae]|nr:hypothetical protein TYRP_006261 [Tyrophagus putrescentiae]
MASFRKVDTSSISAFSTTTTTTSPFSALPTEILESILHRSVSQFPANPGQPPPSEASLTDLVGISLFDDRAQQIIANFVANHWRGVNPPVNGPVAPSMLKLFEGERQLETYRQLVINRLQFHHNRDARFLLNRGEQQHSWRHQDHICLSAFTDTPIDVLISALVALFDTPGGGGGGGRITALVVAAELWTYLATRADPPLRQLHIFHQNGALPLSVQQMAPLISRLQSLTLSQYTVAAAANDQAQLQLLNALNGNVCRQILLKNFDTASAASPAAAYRGSHWEDLCPCWEPRQWWEEELEERRWERHRFEVVHSQAKYQWRIKERDFMLSQAAFRRHWLPQALLTLVAQERQINRHPERRQAHEEQLRPRVHLPNHFDDAGPGAIYHRLGGMVLQGNRWFSLYYNSRNAMNALWGTGRPPFVSVPEGYRSEGEWMAAEGRVFWFPQMQLNVDLTFLGLENIEPVDAVITGPLAVALNEDSQKDVTLLSAGSLKSLKTLVEVPLKDQDEDYKDDIENESPFTLTTVQIVTVTVWLKKMAILVGFGAAPTVVPYISEQDFLTFLYPLQPSQALRTVTDQHRKLQQLVHLWRALIRKLDQMVAQGDEKEEKVEEKEVSITKSELFSLFIKLYHRLFTGQWQPPLPFYYHSPNATEVDPLKPWIVIWTLIHNSFELDNDDDGSISAEIPFFPNTPDYLTTVKGS